MADLTPKKHRWGRGQEMPFPAGRQHRKQEDTTIKHKAQRAAALHLTQITRCSSGQFSGGRRDPFLPLVLLWAGAGFFPGRHPAKAFRAGGTLSPFTKAPKAGSPWSRNPSTTCSFPSTCCRFSLWAVCPLPAGDGGLSVVDGRCRAGGLPVTGLSFASNHFLRS